MILINILIITRQAIAKFKVSQTGGHKMSYNSKFADFGNILGAEPCDYPLATALLMHKPIQCL